MTTDTRRLVWAVNTRYKDSMPLTSPSTVKVLSLVAGSSAFVAVHGPPISILFNSLLYLMCVNNMVQSIQAVTFFLYFLYIFKFLLFIQIFFY